ncbi:ABC transporter H family member 2 [Bienertia sinuspersici]
MCGWAPPSGISSNNWIKLVVLAFRKREKYRKKACAFLNQYHKSGSNSFVNQQEDEHGKKMSLLAL